MPLLLFPPSPSNLEDTTLNPAASPKGRRRLMSDVADQLVRCPLTRGRLRASSKADVQKHKSRRILKVQQVEDQASRNISGGFWNRFGIKSRTRRYTKPHDGPVPSSTFIPPKAPIRKGAAAQRYRIIYRSRTIIFADMSEFVQITSMSLSTHFCTVLKRRSNSNWCTINDFTVKIQNSRIVRSHRTI